MQAGKIMGIMAAVILLLLLMAAAMAVKHAGKEMERWENRERQKGEKNEEF